MSYKKIEEIQRAARTEWSAERGGRTRQKVAGTWVRKYAFSPYTARARREYTFYADVEMLQEIESPPGSGRKRKFLTIPAHVGTFLGLRDAVLSGEVMERIRGIVELSGGVEIVGVEFWRNRGKQEEASV